MSSYRIYRDVEDLSESSLWQHAATRPWGECLLMCPPRYFAVVEAINPHMVTRGGELQQVDASRAGKEWQALVDVLRKEGQRLEFIEPAAGLVDMVFCANQSLPYLDGNGRLSVLMSRMATPRRMNEVEFFRRWYAERGYREVSFEHDAQDTWEGMGDLLWYPGFHVLFAGCGPRTTRGAVERLPELLQCPVILLELKDPRFYHLDTALALLGDGAALACSEAFKPRSMELLRALLPGLIELPPGECLEGFACNAQALSGGRVVLDARCVDTKARLESRGFKVLTVETGEFRKSGGSVFCMTCVLPEQASP